MSEPKQILTAVMLVVALAGLGLTGCAREPAPAPVSFNAELEYLEKILQRSTPREPLLVFVLAAEYLNSGQRERGIRLLTDLLEERGKEMSPEQRAIYLNALGLIRAAEAHRIPLLTRNSWVKDTVGMLEEARSLAGEEDILARFVNGIVFAQLPKRFGKREQAYADLQWLLDGSRDLPQPGFLREAHYQLARLHDLDGRRDESSRHLKRSGYPDLEREALLLTSSAVNAETGHTFYPRRLREVVPGRIFTLSGFEFTEYSFIVTADRKQLISIDAGTRPDSAEAAYQYLKERHPNLPPLTTVLVTHSHWDHVGGHSFFRELNPEAIFYSRGNYQDELDLVSEATIPFDYFFGTRFSNDLLVGYEPDVTVDRPTDLVLGGTRLTLIPVPGGETSDGLFVHLPREKTLFVGDFIMPYIGAPFFEEGEVSGLLEAIEIAVSLNPKHILHGHEPLTSIWSTPERLTDIGGHLAWLFERVTEEVRAGRNRADLHRLNLIPPDLSQDEWVQMGYLILRENFISRVYDQNVGYWERDLEGMNPLGAQDYAALLVRYLARSEAELTAAVEQMLEEGDFELARRVSEWSLSAFPESAPLKELRRKALIKLKEKYQFSDPFKFIIYSNAAGDPTPQLEVAWPEP